MPPSPKVQLFEDVAKSKFQKAVAWLKVHWYSFGIGVLVGAFLKWVF